MDSDSNTVSQASSYDQEIAQVVNNYSNMVYDCSLRILSNHQHAEDVTQSTFILFSQKFKEFSSDVKIGGWLYRTATFIAKNEQRIEARRMNSELESSKNNNASDSPDWQSVSPYIDEFIAILPENQRNAILLKYMQGKSQEEIGTLMNCSRGTVSSWISRGLESLRCKLRKKGIVLTGSALAMMMTVRLKAESTASLNSAVLQGISAGGKEPSVILKNYISRQTLFKLKMVASGLAVILAVIGYFLLSTSQDQSFSTHEIEKNKTLETAKVSLVIKKKSQPSPKKNIRSVSPLIIGQAGISFSGKIKDLIVSPDGQTLAVLTELKNSSHIYLVNAYDKTIDHKIVSNYNSTYDMNFVGNDKLVFTRSLRIDSNEIIVYDLIAQQIIHEFTAPMYRDLTVSADGNLFVSASHDAYRFKNEGVLPTEFNQLVQNHINDSFEEMKEVFASGNTDDIEEYKDFIPKISGDTIESHADVVTHAAKIKAELYDELLERGSDFLITLFRESIIHDDILIFDVNTGKLTEVMESACSLGSSVEDLLFNDDKKELVVIESPWRYTRDNTQTINRYDLKSLQPIQTLKNETKRVIFGDFLKWGHGDVLLGRQINIDFNKSKIKRGHLQIFDVDRHNGKLYTTYKAGEHHYKGRVIKYYGEGTPQWIVCEDLVSGEKLFKVKLLDVEFNHIRVNSITNELLLWKKGASNFASFDLASQKLKEDSRLGFTSSPRQLFFKENNELIVEESNNFHTYDLRSGVNYGRFFLDKPDGMDSFPVNNSNSLLTFKIYEGKVSMLDLASGEKIKRIGEGFKSGVLAPTYKRRIYVNRYADLVAIDLSLNRKEVAVHKISSGEKVFSLKLDGREVGPTQKFYVRFNDSGSLMYLGDDGFIYKDNSPTLKEPKSGIYNLSSGTRKAFMLKSGEEVSKIYDMIVNEKANLVFMRTFDERGTHYAGVWDATTGECVKEIQSSDDFEIMQGFKPPKIPVEGISDNGRYLLTVNGAYDIDNDRFVWNWQDTSDGLKPSGTTIIDETQSTIVNVSYDLITVKDMLSGETLKQFRLVLPEDKSASLITGGIWSSAINKLVLKLKEPEVWILDLNKEAI